MPDPIYRDRITYRTGPALAPDPLPVEYWQTNAPGSLTPEYWQTNAVGSPVAEYWQVNNP